MNANSFLSPRMLAGAAIVGLVGAAGVFIYEQVYAEKRRAMLVTEVQRLDHQMNSMRLELESLRKLQKEIHLKRQKSRRARREAAAAAAQRGAGRGDAGDEPDAQGGPLPEGDELSYASDSEYFTDYQSVLGTDGELDSEEFYDVHTDDEDDTLRETGRETASDEDLPEKCEKTPPSSPRHET